MGVVRASPRGEANTTERTERETGRRQVGNLSMVGRAVSVQEKGNPCNIK